MFPFAQVSTWRPSWIFQNGCWKNTISNTLSTFSVL